MIAAFGWPHAITACVAIIAAAVLIWKHGWPWPFDD